MFNDINDIESAEKKISSFTNAMIFCSVLPFIFFLQIILALHKFPNEMIEPFVTCDIIFILGLALKITKSRAISIIIFLVLLDCSISGILASSGIPKSGTIVAILLTISAMMSIKATFLRHKLLGGVTVLKNVLIRNLLGVIYSFIFIFIVIKFIILLAYFHSSIVMTKLMPNLNLIISVILFFGVILYCLALVGKLPFTKKFKMVIYPEKNNSIE